MLVVRKQPELVYTDALYQRKDYFLTLEDVLGVGS